MKDGFKEQSYTTLKNNLMSALYLSYTKPIAYPPYQAWYHGMCLLRINALGDQKINILSAKTFFLDI